MARIDLGAIQQRLAQQQPPPVPAEPPSWLTRPAPASALRTTPPKPRLATASAAAPTGTLRATTTMRAALSLEATNARAVRAEERARVAALRAQIDEAERRDGDGAPVAGARKPPLKAPPHHRNRPTMYGT